MSAQKKAFTESAADAKDAQGIAQIATATGQSVDQVKKQLAAANVDPLVVMTQNLIQDVRALGVIFDENARRREARNANLPPEQHELPDAAALKDLIDAEAKAAAAILALRNEQRKQAEDMMRAQMHAHAQEKKAKVAPIGFKKPAA